ncbi:hypothetical protein GCM10029964_020120 [Kibdelosporangium lantanae]
MTSPTRKALASAQRIVVKVGSSSLTTAAGGLDPHRLDALVDALAARYAQGSQVVLVSSGAIAAGLAPLGIARRPRDLATQQAAASVGQLALAHAYASSFARYSLTVGQVLLTADDVVRRSHYRNAQRTFSRLLALNTVPVVNENDTVATEEIRFGDNDRLAALVAHLVGADALFLLSDVDGLYDGDPRAAAGARRIDEVTDDSDVDGVKAGAQGASGLGTGGMASKLAAARLASSAGIPVLLTAAAQAPGTDHGRRRHRLRGHRRPALRPTLLARPRGRRRGASVAGRRGRGSGGQPPPFPAQRRNHGRGRRVRRG